MSLEDNKIQTRNIKEFNIPVPWGYITVKAWGNENDPHALVFHGRMDNAGSFDNLIPLLPNTYYYICIDLPGHGKSSHFPSSLPIHSIDYLISCKLLVEYFKKETYILIGHSYGGQIAFLFSRVYPNYVKTLITLDALPLFPVETNKTIKYLRQKVDTAINIQEKLSIREPPSYSYEEALEKLSNARYNGETLSREAAESLLKRSIIQKDDGKYYFSTDQRMKAYINPLHDMRYLIYSIKNDPVTVPTLMIFAKLNDEPRKKFAKVLEHLQTYKNINILYVDGAHDVHNNHPERVARYVNKFLLSRHSKL